MVQASKIFRKKLGQILLDEGLIKEDQIVDALKRQRDTGEFLSESLINLGFLSELDIAGSLVRQFGLPYIDAARYRISKDALAVVPALLMWQNLFIVLDKIGSSMLLAVSGVISGEVLEKVEKASRSQICLYIATSSQVAAALEKHVPLNGKADKPEE